MVVVEGSGASLFGHSWLQHIRLNWAEIKTVRNSDLLGRMQLCSTKSWGNWRAIKHRFMWTLKHAPGFASLDQSPMQWGPKWTSPRSGHGSSGSGFDDGKHGWFPIFGKDIASWTKRDPVLSRVYQFTQEGWPATFGDDLKLYEVRKTELTTRDGCVMWGNRVVIPSTVREAMLVELHAGHPGWRLWVSFGSRVWITILKNAFNSVQVVSWIVKPHLKHHYNLGVGPYAPGPMCISILQVQWLVERCTLSWLMLTASG